MTTETPSSRKVIIEQRKRLSDALLWKLQREYFDKQGINAWVNQVPFYITSNPFIAKCYAEVAVHFIRDVLQKNPDAKKHTFYILELGTGSGRFSYYTMKTIHHLLHTFGMDDVSICYVMSDFTKHNITYHETHPALLPYIEKGQVDFAIYDMESEKPITLLRKNIKLGPEELVNPLIVFANYIFDTISHDSFAVHEEKLYELLLDLSTEEQNMENNYPIDMEKINVDYNVNEIKKSSYYNDPHIDSILELYKKSLRETSFLIPIGSLRAIKHLKKMSNDRLLLIVTDKSYSEMSSLENLGHPHIAFHGSFSLMVNLHAISEYFKNSGGDFLLQSPRQGIKSAVFCSGFKLKDMPETEAAVEQYIDGFSPADYFNLHKHMSETADNCDLDALSSHLLLSEWDPSIYSRMTGRISQLLPNASSDSIKFLSNNMGKIASNYYYMPKSDCILFEIAVFFHSTKQYEQALKYYRESQPYVGEKFGLVYNIALCLHHVDKQQESLEEFKKASLLDAESKETQEWITYIEKLMAEKAEKKE